VGKTVVAFKAVLHAIRIAVVVAAKYEEAKGSLTNFVFNEIRSEQGKRRPNKIVHPSLHPSCCDTAKDQKQTATYPLAGKS
jgi:hypothetical protein